MSQPQENQLQNYNQTMQAFPSSHQDFLSKEEIELLKKTKLAKFSPNEQDEFIIICQRARLDPFTKQVYATIRYSKVRQPDGSTKKIPGLVPVIGIMGMTAAATRTGKYDGCEIHWTGKDGVWREEWLEVDPPEAARCKVFHKDRSRPEVCIARWGSFVGQQYDYESKSWYITDFWNKMPDFMLAKCAKAGALRGAFPDQLSGLYIGEELESGITEEVTEAIPSDEDRYREAREKEAKLVAAHPEQVVSPTKPPPAISPEEALEPAFEQDKVQPKPTEPVPKPAAKAAVTDELDLSSPRPTDKAPWREHKLTASSPKALGRFYGRKLSELNQMELSVLGDKYLSAIRKQWDDATDEQQHEAQMLEAAIAFSRMEKPF